MTTPRDHVHVFDLVDGDPVTVEKYSNVGHGAQFTVDGVTTVLPWAQVKRVRRADRNELRRYAADDYDGDVPAAVQSMIDDVDYQPGDPVEDPPPAPPPGTTVELDGPTADNPERGTVRAGAGQEQVGKPPEEVEAMKTDTTADPDRAREWPSDADDGTIREWAKEQGLNVKDSGPIPRATRDAYAAANS